MIYEQRSYAIAEGRIDEFIDNATAHAMPLQARHGFVHVAFWRVVAHQGEDVELDFVYLLQFASMEDRERRWHAFLTDPEWVARQADVDASEPIVRAERVLFLESTPFSALP